ncbi:hypothetical protein GLOTRDRAFT_110197 [Gloeophyllum trabeum ATCC 11539]|uniref:Uncharacterized protein n=1 Tax=Gloeophyllum trabeum (strain ATCC 11539 / FP-39264 / Madison 617) TaxID=670483 RepID=S7QF16_GLOTA|nr:uncharacterized protein GLOTRDRAFT_110197 [Gloeophyllum trabeum ATCC 11539]EPQ58426.1 hypothetical protein GLOTRDRAFT_110197 [Gloeophyllum trabeum ATCC 11539]
MTSPSYGNEIPVEPNSLYICLNQILSPGFHWSLYVTDAKGAAVRYEWAEVQGRASTSDPLEAFFYTPTHPVMEITRDLSCNLAFIKISAYTAPANPTIQYYVSMFHDIFPTSFSNVKRNRDHGISCRTWLMAALERMRTAGVINLSASEVAGLEARVIAIGQKAEEEAAKGDFTTVLTAL